jgi:phage terminase small subunit
MQMAFCQEYLKNGKNGTAAAKAAGAKDAKTYASRNLKRKEVIAYLETLKEGARETIKEEFSYTAIESFKKFKEIQTKALCDKQYTAAIKAEELIGKLAGLYENEQQSRPQDITITVKTSADLRAEEE